jgi:hypothetical protein
MRSVSVRLILTTPTLMTESVIDALSSISVSGVAVRLWNEHEIHISVSEFRAYLDDRGLAALTDGGLVDAGEEATTF